MTERKGPPGLREERASITIKISRAVREHITKSTELAEPIDRTLRRLLGLRVPKGAFEPKKRDPSEDGKRPALLTTVRITAGLHEFVTKRARWNESIDTTLRRLLGVRVDGEGEAVSAAKAKG